MNKQQITKIILEASLESRTVLEASIERLSPEIERAARKIASSIKRGGKVLICGNGGSAADSQHMAAELVGRYLRERDAWPAIALSTDNSIVTSLANDYGFDEIFSRQVKAFGKKSDVLVAISTSGNSANVLNAMKAARESGMAIIALCGKGGGKMHRGADILLDASSTHTPRIQETHGLIIHVLCDIVEQLLTQ